MTDKTNKPVIFLAFANDRDDTVGYLRNLPDEARRLSDVLQPAEQAGLCEVVVKQNSTAGDIFKVFQDPKYRNRIAIFHYGGHANGYQLLLESREGKAATADAGGLAAFLAQQQGLQLVFLNGCSTQPQTQELLDANISMVISTSRSIDDKVATDFAFQFYQGLAGKVTVRAAFNEAAATARTANGGDPRKLYFGGKENSRSQLEADRWPWNLYLREGSESADGWNLPDAANNPLAGLPPLPSLKLPEELFKHLNWFTRDDAEVFFGRGHQIRKLYNRLTDPRSEPIVLFYGQSGVGKSSLLAAGLLPRLERDYEVRYVRREKDGLLATLCSELLPEAGDMPIETAWIAKEERMGKPLIVFLDQVEEFYTRPIEDMPDELEQLLRVVKDTFSGINRRPKGKLVLGFREEWLAKLETRVKEYQLPRSEVHLEPLDRRGIIEAILGPARSERLRGRYALTVEEGLAEMIADDMLADRGSAISTTLQILLSKMWAVATQAKQPNFNRDLYLNLRDKGILLGDFLDQQLKDFQARLPAPADSGLLLDVLERHTTSHGTASQYSSQQLLEQYAHVRAVLPDLLRECESLYLLTKTTSDQRESTHTTRLAHDTLAPLVRERFDKSDRPGQRARRILDNRSVDWKGEQVGTPLDAADLKVVERGTSGTRVLNSTEQRLLAASRVLRAKLRRNRRIRQIVGVVMVIVVAGLGIYAEFQRRAAEHRSAMANAERLGALSTMMTPDTPSLGTLLAVEAIKATNDLGYHVPSAEQALRNAMGFCNGRALCGHEREIFSVAFSADNRWVATASYDGSVRLWDTNGDNTASSTIVLSHGEDAVREAAFSKNGKWLVTAGLYQGTKLWNLQLPDWWNKKPVELKTKYVRSAKFSSDSRWLVTAGGTGVGERGEVVLWNLESPVREAARIDRSSDVMAIDFSPDGKSLALGGKEGMAAIWHPAEPKNSLIELQGHSETVMSTAFSPDGRWLATGSLDGARLWKLDGDNPSVATILPHPDNEVILVAISPDSRLLATTGVSVTVRLWNIQSVNLDKPQFELRGHGKEVFAVAFDPNGKWVATGSRRDKTARLWNLHSDDPNRGSTVLRGHSGSVISLAFSSENRLVTGSMDSTARMWELSNPIPGDAKHVLQTDGAINEISFWNTGELLLRSHSGLSVASFPRNGSRPKISPLPSINGGIVRSADNTWMFGVMKEDREAKRFSIGRWPSGPMPRGGGVVLDRVNSSSFPFADILALSNDNRWMLFVEDTFIVGLAGPQAARLYHLGESMSVDEYWNLSGHPGSVVSAEFSPDNAYLVIGSPKLTARVLKLNAPDPTESFISLKGETTKENEWFSSTKAPCTFSPDGTWLVMRTGHKTVGVWKTASLQSESFPFVLNLAAEPNIDSASDLSVAFTTNSQWLFVETVASGQKIITQVYSLRNGHIGKATIFHDEKFLGASHDGDWFVTSCANSIAKLRMLEGTEVGDEHIALRDSDAFREAIFSIDGRWLATRHNGLPGCNLWDLNSDDPSQTKIELKGYNTVNQVSQGRIAFSPDSRYLAAIDGRDEESGSTPVRVWDLRFQDLLDEAKRRVGRNLTQSESQRYFRSAEQRTFEEF